MRAETRVAGPTSALGALLLGLAA